MNRNYRSILKVLTFTTEKLVRLLRSSRKIEESPYKPETFHLWLKLGACPGFRPQTISKQNKVPKGRTITWLLSIF